LRGGWRLLDLVRKSLVKYKIRRFSRGPNTQTWSRFGPSEYVNVIIHNWCFICY
jgi:hypothetical protein